jgi:hypothetical protein
MTDEWYTGAPGKKLPCLCQRRKLVRAAKLAGLIQLLDGKHGRVTATSISSQDSQEGRMERQAAKSLIG